jgi:hypothetical protein
MTQRLAMKMLRLPTKTRWQEMILLEELMVGGTRPCRKCLLLRPLLNRR